MTDDLKWTIGKEAGNGTHLDLPPYRVYFYWMREGMLVAALDYSKAELEAEIANMKSRNEDTSTHEAALKSLLKF